MLNRILASFGIGSAKVDAKLSNNHVRIGEDLKGEIHIKGGSVEQSISQIYMYLFTYYYREGNNNETLHKEVLATFRVSDTIDIYPGKEKVIPFQLSVPYHTPISFNKQKVYLSTGLDIERAVDPKDLDPVIVHPDPLMEVIFRQMDNLGFRHTYDSGKCIPASHIHRALPFVQEFEYKPQGIFRDRLDKIELIFDVHESGMDILIQVDKRANNIMGIFAETLNLDEEHFRASVYRETGVPVNLMEKKIREALGI